MPIKHLIEKERRAYGTVEPEKNARRQQKRDRKWLKIIILGGIALCVACFIIGTIVVVVVSRELPDPQKLSERQVAQSTKIYDRTGEHLLYEVYQDQKRTMVELDQIAPLAIKATVAVEDKNFYTHNGVRLISIIRAGVNNLIGRQAGSGGASTLTQQLIKNTIIGGERSYFRKIKEAILALRLEKKYTKDQIMKMYLNEIPYGSTNYGIEAASQSYFRKKAIDLSLAESATLAALLKQPTRYLNDQEMLKERRNVVLRLMNEQGYISEEEKTAAQNETLKIIRNAGIMDAPHFVLYVKQLLAEQFGEKTVDQSGLKVITTLDYDKQKIAESAVKELGDKFAKDANADNASLVAIAPSTGEILAMVGSRDFQNEEIDGQFNVAVLGKRQPGSSFKPFVYTAAFEKGFTPETVLYDVSTNFDMRTGGNYTPVNYDNKEHGLVTLRKALQGSLNIPAVKTLYLVGEQYMSDFAERFGYTTLKGGNFGLSLVLGGAEVNLLEHTNAYATLANNGRYHQPSSILKVTDDKGATIFEAKTSEGSEAVKPELAALISSVLTDDNARSYIFGRGSTLTLPDRLVAAKTGTTNNYKDAWTLGYVPSLAAGVWVGNTTPAPMKGGGNTLAGQIWNRFMKLSLASTSPEQFPAPPANDTDKAVLRGGDGVMRIKINRLNGKLATSSTPEALIAEKEFLPPHDILYYVNKDDPRGPIPAFPADDPQYENWESALQDWARREQEAGRLVSFSEPPAEVDLFSADPALAPTIEIVSPLASSTILDRNIVISVNASAPRGISQVTFKLDDNTIAVKYGPPFSTDYYLKNLNKGLHILTVLASDDVGNSSIREITFDLQAELDPPDFNWVDGSSITVRSDDFPRSIGIIPFRWSDIKNIQIKLTGNDQNKLIYTFDHNDQLLVDKLNFSWKNSPGAGVYELVGLLTGVDGKTVSKTLEVRVE
ncbi:MAG: penicillin-binding protein [Candidatus Magasanikbacteria bacterium]|nr:penicillin-binding protein [Candidatus Magasanikbacteria bacterium]